MLSLLRSGYMAEDLQAMPNEMPTWTRERALAILRNIQYVVVQAGDWTTANKQMEKALQFLEQEGSSVEDDGKGKWTVRRYHRELKQRNQPFECVLRDGQLIMRVGVDVIAFAENERRKYEGLPVLRFLNRGKFAEDVAHELTLEEENGDTPIYLLLDKMIEAALNNGSTHAFEVEASHGVES